MLIMLMESFMIMGWWESRRIIFMLAKLIGLFLAMRIIRLIRIYDYLTFLFVNFF